MQIPSVHTGQMSGGAINRQFFRSAGAAAAIGIGLPTLALAVEAVPAVGWLAARRMLAGGAERFAYQATSPGVWKIYAGYQIYQDRNEISDIAGGADWGLRFEIEVMPLPIRGTSHGAWGNRVLPIPFFGPDLYIKTVDVPISQSTPSSDHTADLRHGGQSSTPTIRGGGADNSIQSAARSGQFFHWRKGRNLLD